jgi:hypothetical protein
MYIYICWDKPPYQLVQDFAGPSPFICQVTKFLAVAEGDILRIWRPTEVQEVLQAVAKPHKFRQGKWPIAPSNHPNQGLQFVGRSHCAKKMNHEIVIIQYVIVVLALVLQVFQTSQTSKQYKFVIGVIHYRFMLL